MRQILTRRVLAAVLASTLTAALGVALTTRAATRPEPAPALSETAATTANPVTPGNFTGYGFDQCQAPSQKAMDAWLKRSPYLAVGVYISGDSRACRYQTYLNATWVRTQLAKGWKLLPIDLGPQASCQSRFPRYRDDFKISAKPGPRGLYPTAGKQGTTEAAKALADARALGIVPGSTIFYDLEGYDVSNTACRESALRFLSSWNAAIKKAGYLAGTYSSAGAGLNAIDSARLARPTAFTYPDQIWLARYDNQANTSSSYLSGTGWQPHGRVKQYRGGHDETYGGVRINIDNDYVDLGQGTVAPTVSHCGGLDVDLDDYPAVAPRTVTSKRPDATMVKVLKCLLKEQGLYKLQVRRPAYLPALVRAVSSFQTAHGLAATGWMSRSDWVALLSAGAHPTVKFGSGGEDVRALQRALNAADAKLDLPVTGVYAAMTVQAVKAYQKANKLPVTGVVAPGVWKTLWTGKI